MMISVELVETTCWCGISFAVPENLKRYHKETVNHEMYCPLGHSGISRVHEQREVERLKLEVQRKDNELADVREKQAKMERRIHRGVCPFCKRHFINVARHMACRHKVIDVNGTKLLEAKK